MPERVKRWADSPDGVGVVRGSIVARAVRVDRVARPGGAAWSLLLTALLLTALLLTALLLSVATPRAWAKEAAAEARARSRRVDVGAMPLFSYSTDEGAGLGINAALFRRGDDVKPYRYAVTLNLFVTTRDIQHHMLRLDIPRFRGSEYRPMLLVRFERDPVRPYYGVGNDTVIDPTLRGAERRSRYLHTLTQPQATLTVERPIGRGFEVAAAVLGAYQKIETSPQSLLALEAPAGVEGGVLAEVTAEVALDTRDNEASPISGAYVELIGRAGQLAGKHVYGGGALVARGYVSPFGTAALTIATRFDVDLLLGDVPFTRLGTFAGRPPVAGLGGATSIRGLPRFLLIGNLKALGNVELRSRLRRFRPGEHTLDVMVAGFVDAGRVWADGDRGSPFTDLHATAGGGVRLAWEEDYVVRLDVGRSFEGFTGVYLDFAQAF